LIGTIVTFVTTRLVTVFVTTMVVVATVPSVIVLTHSDTIAITTESVASGARRQGEADRARWMVELRKAGDEVIARISAEEGSCDARIAQLAAHSKLSATATQAAIQKGKHEFHAASAPFVREVRDDEDEFDNLAVVSVETEQFLLARISQVRTTALGVTGPQGVLATACQTILIEVQVTTTTVPGDAGGD